MAPSHPQSQPLDSVNLALRSTDTAAPAPPWQVEGMIEDAVAPGQRDTPSTRLAGELTARKQRSLWSDAWRRLRRNKLAVVGLLIVVTFSLIAIFAPLIAPYDQAEVVDFRLARYPPSWTWPMGLDANGRDMFSRMAYGAQVSLVVGVLAQAIVLLIGVPVGAIAGYFGGAIRPPQASWGQMVAEGSKPGYIESSPHMLLFPVVAIGLTMLGFTFLGDGLRDALDPKGSKD